jgi:hypothetical protein
MTTYQAPDVDFYLDAAIRKNTRRSYEAAVRHFEVDWGGFLPASSDSIAKYWPAMPARWPAAP